METQAETRLQRRTLRVTSPAFGAGAPIPIEHTGEGDDVSPPLAWSAPPPGTRGFAILVEDPDAPNPAAPQRTFVHWVITGIAPNITHLLAGHLPPGAVQGTNDFGARGWRGPMPPIGRHRYFFKVFALDIALAAPGITKLELLAAMKGHILAEGELIGTYQRQ